MVCYASGHDYVETTHLLLGLLQGSEGVWAQLIENQGADVKKIREEASHNAFYFELNLLSNVDSIQ